MPVPCRPRRVSPRVSRPVTLVVIGIALVLAMVGCAPQGTGVEQASVTTTVASSHPSSGSGTPTTAAPSAPSAPSTAPFADFKQVTITVVDANGETRQFCLWLADTEVLRQRGLMFVEDRTLGGLPGMLFLFDSDSSGGFWMKNTRLPLSIAYVQADGSIRSIRDMEPCPDSTASCPSYPAGGSYRYAIEVPKGELGRLGVSDRARVTVGARSCPAPASSS